MLLCYRSRVTSHGGNSCSFFHKAEYYPFMFLFLFIGSPIQQSFTYIMQPALWWEDIRLSVIICKFLFIFPFKITRAQD